MKIFRGSGYSKEEAAKAVGFKLDLKKCKNASVAFQKKDTDTSDTSIESFINEYIDKYKVVAGYIVLSKSKSDTRERPYMAINNPTVERRTWKTVYQVVPADVVAKSFTEEKVKEDGTPVSVMTPYKKVVKVIDRKLEDGTTEPVEKVFKVPEVKCSIKGMVEAESDKKDKAIALAKDLVEKNHKDYAVVVVKEVTNDTKYAAYVKYTPSKSAVKGEFVFFINE